MKKKYLLFSVFCYLLFIFSAQAQNIIYINASATGANNGSSWVDAFTDFQVGVNAASTGDNVFVAAGTYQPASGQSFSMKEGVKIYGGFAGTETSLNQRSLKSGNASILKGNGNCVIHNVNNGLTATAVLDGFTITGGKTDNNGGGMFNANSSPLITNCTFSGNTTTGGGGGIFNELSSSIITNCLFSGNTAGTYGGGEMNGASSSITNTNCTFSGNTANSYGGGMFNASSSLPTITNSIFWGNTAPVGTDIYQNDGSLIINYSYTQNTQNGKGNITGSSDPFVNSSNPAGADGVFGTADDGLELAVGSVAINAGDPQTNTAGYAVQAGNTDITGNSRILYNKIDIGAYEFNSVVLPVTLVNFTGSLQDGLVQLQWYTGVETNFNHFEVQKATVILNEGWQSQPQGEIPAKGNNSSYAYITKQIEPTAYYRLKMVDKDGNSKYSNIVMLSQSGSSSVLVYPNPAKDHVNININKAGNIRIYDASGKLIKAQALQAGVNRIDVSELTGGVYYGVVDGTKVSFVKE